MQKGKGKAAAATASQPQLASQAMDSEDASQVEQDIAVTSGLLERFNAHADTWEALEVSIWCTLGLLLYPLGVHCLPLL